MKNYKQVEINETELKQLLLDPKNVLQMFMGQFVEANGYDHSKVKAEITENKGTHTMWKGKLWKSHQKNTALIGLQHEDFSIIFGEGTTTSIEIYMIETKTQNKGIGTLVMNQVLDLADELELDITLIPTPYKNLNDDKYCTFLRTWYLSFGFKPSPFSPIMKYKHQK